MLPLLSIEFRATPGVRLSDKSTNSGHVYVVAQWRSISPLLMPIPGFALEERRR